MLYNTPLGGFLNYNYLGLLFIGGVYGSSFKHSLIIISSVKVVIKCNGNTNGLMG